MKFDTPTNRLYALSAFGLSIVQFLVFLIADPFLGPSQQWYYLRIGQRIMAHKDPFYEIANRQFGSLGLALNDWLFPGRFQTVVYIHILTLLICSFLIFHIFHRLKPGYAWFAFLVAAVYLVYIPADAQHMTFWLSTYSWALLLMLISACLLIEYAAGRGGIRWLYFGLAVVLAYMACRAYEGVTFILLLAGVPLIFYFQRKITTEKVIASVVWLAVVLIALVMFLIPFLEGDDDTWYQTSRASDDKSIPRLVESTIQHQRLSFPSWEIVEKVPFDYVLPSLMLCLVILGISVIFWRRFPEECRLPSPLILGFLAIFSLGMITVSGAGYIYADLLDNQRNQFFNAPFNSLFVVSFFALVALLLQRRLKFRLMPTFITLLMLVFFVGGHWYYQHYRYWLDPTTDPLDRFYPFYERTPFFDEMTALLPNLEDETAVLLYNCDGDEMTPTDFWSANDYYVLRYLYDWESSGILGGGFPEHTYTAEGLSSSELDLLPASDPIPTGKMIGYEQMIVLECAPDGLRIVTAFPEGFAPSEAGERYNPYARIKGGFLPPDVARILAQ
jgi:hypothetical protein